jgi:hypothetical protein
LLRCYGLPQALAVAHVNTTLASGDYWKRVLSALRRQASIPEINRLQSARRADRGYEMAREPRRNH